MPPFGANFLSPHQHHSAEIALLAPSNWRRSLSQAIRDPAILVDRLGLSREFLETFRPDHAFPLLVTESFLARMTPGDEADPLLLQIWPSRSEGDIHVGDLVDPVGDLDRRSAPGLIHKYHGRALLVATGACAIHCRYCFRRHYPYDQDPKRLDDWEAAIREIEHDHSIDEVILSGGDPLMLTDDRLGALVEKIAAIPHVQRLRVHTRLPIVLPDRITKELIDIFQGTRLQPIFVVHANHPREIVNDCAQALGDLVRSGIPALNQAVLLHGINDNAPTLIDLCQRLINLGVIPYYLHQLDRVVGGRHFEVNEEIGQRLIQQLRDRLPGYAVPRYVREVAGESAKAPVETR